MDKPFEIGDKVFAKIRGYPAWPARIENIDRHASGRIKFHVLFYGTFETGVCKFEELFHYNENKEKYGKPINRRGFREALDQIEGLTPFPLVNTVKKEHDCDDALLSFNENSETDFPNQVDKRKLKRKRDSGIDSNEKVYFNRNKRSIAPPKKKFKSSISDTTTNNSPSVISKPDLVRRSNRKAKPKKFADEDSDEEKCPKRIERCSIKKESHLDLAEENDIKTKIVCEEPLSRLSWFKNEARLLELESSIRSHLGLNNANTEKTIEALQQLYKLNIKPLMLKKYPRIVQTIKKLRRYVGNIEEWNFTKEQRLEFVNDAADIRTEAENVFKKFRDIFSVPSETTFSKLFEKEVSDFKKLTVSLTHEKLCALTQDPAADVDNFCVIPTAKVHIFDTGSMYQI